MLGLGGGDPHLPVFGPLTALLPLMFPITDPRSFLPIPGLAAFGIMGLFILGLLRLNPLREGFQRAGKLTYRVGRWLLIDVPTWIWGISMLRRFMKSWPFQLFYWYLFKPVLASLILRMLVPQAFNTLLSAGSIFLAVNFILNSRLGQAVGEAAAQGLFHLYELLRAGLVPGLFRLVTLLFKQIMDTIEYVLATVDEWLRFRAEDSRLSMFLRVVLGVCWFPVSYLTRFYTVVLIEPGFNPIKAPLSLMAAKFIVPFTGAKMWELLDKGPEMSLLSILAWTTALLTLWLVPDAFTFLFWEMKENWKLYRANRWPNLRPVPVGSHGETLRRLLYPGFHSGTVPRLFARLRQAEREAAETGNWRVARTCRRSLQEVETTLRRFLARDFIRLVQQSPSWQGLELSVAQVILASNRIRLELARSDDPEHPAWLEFLEHAGWLVASFPQPGWLAQLHAEQGQAVTMGLAGLYKLAGVDFVLEQIQANLPPEFHGFDITDRNLVMWLDQRHGKGVFYDLVDRSDPIKPRNTDGSIASDWPVLPASQMIFSQVPLSWEKWVECWQNERTFQPRAPLFNSELKMLPAIK
jgi:hypothetical protein